MHMLSRKDFEPSGTGNRSSVQNPPQLLSQTMDKCKQMSMRQNNAHDLELFVSVRLPEDTPAVLSGKLREEHGYTYEWASGPKPQWTQKLQNRLVQCGERRADCCPRIVDRFFQLEREFVFRVVTAGHV